MIKFTCFDKCLQDCNGVNCGDTAQPDTGMTRLQLTGSGQICDKPVSEQELLAQCQTTGMIMEDDEFVDDFVRESSSQSGGFDDGMTSGGRPNSDGMFGSGGQGGRPSMGGGSSSSSRPNGMSGGSSGMGSGGWPSGGSSSGGRPNGMSGDRPNGMDGDSNGGGMSGGRPSGMNSGGGSGGRPNGMSGSNGGSGRPNGSSSSGGRPSGMGGDTKPDGVDIQSLLSEKCPEFDCASMSEQDVDCSRFDSMNTRGGRKSMLWCGCCRD